MEVTPEMRKNQMVMMEEFRRRKRLGDYWDEMTELQRKEATRTRDVTKAPMDMKPETLKAVDDYHGSNAERYFEPAFDEVFNPSEFTLVFLDSDSVTNVTSLNRVNSRRVLFFVGNGNGLVSYGKGKADEYE